MKKYFYTNHYTTHRLQKCVERDGCGIQNTIAQKLDLNMEFF